MADQAVLHPQRKGDGHSEHTLSILASDNSLQAEDLVKIPEIQ
jgi:hypothetical protein